MGRPMAPSPRKPMTVGSRRGTVMVPPFGVSIGPPLLKPTKHVEFQASFLDSNRPRQFINQIGGSQDLMEAARTPYRRRGADTSGGFSITLGNHGPSAVEIFRRDRPGRQ